jgi:hypothetical protein
MGVPVMGVPVMGVPVMGVPVMGVPVMGVPVMGVPVMGVPVFRRMRRSHIECAPEGSGAVYDHGAYTVRVASKRGARLGLE